MKSKSIASKNPRSISQKADFTKKVERSQSYVGVEIVVTLVKYVGVFTNIQSIENHKKSEN